MPECKKADYSLSYILKVTLPLVLSALTTALMMSIDRFVVSLFSVEAMNALSIAGSYMGVLVMFFSSITAISTVFVGQLNGKCEHEKLAEPVWQMIYFSLLIAMLSIPFTLYPDLICLLPDRYYDLGILYQEILTGGMFIPTMYNAIAGFFIGQGKTAIITAIVILSNILNLILDIVLVFGIDGIIPSYGVAGAAIATVVSSGIGLLILISITLTRENRLKFKTLSYAFNKQMFLECIKVGLPLAVDRIFNLSAWSLIFILFGRVSNDLATLESITVSVYLVLCCYPEGLNKGAASIVSNLIGNNMSSKIRDVFKSYMFMNIVFSFLISIPLVFAQGILFFFLGKMNGDVSHLHAEFEFIFYILSATIFFDGIMWVISGILAAWKDTLWPAVVNTALVWGIIVFPTVYMYCTNTLTSVRVVNALSALTSLVTAILFYIRYKNTNALNNDH